MKIRNYLIVIVLAVAFALNGFAAPALAANNYSYIAPEPIVMIFLNNFKYLMTDREARLQTIIHSAAIEAGITGLNTAQIPGDRLVIGAVQINMVIEIAAEYGEEIDKSAAIAITQSALATAIGTQIIDGIVRWMPGLGNLVHMGTASSVTETIGWTTVAYFKNRAS
ncbi:hypothetical protein G7B40_028630 [Aetokthonos hydrillicola Thurmond2011]|jgi:uncharacterized protein (DUF697 family)|uniref:Uncharacterized protein n=1 Tax=Aetokthonos hydrillicola Thurmond2011 TaxID=2712845 RepID=A0AAP5IDS0_9CYAN|nr:hypothetical protein [Aetokthonos hydrillicola]MBO3461999.1 hypothetical protein [Aetokthonos hydrillicola CCALA 1050]MBW4584298.1 hypothetical protein [Aetokthonos hydrillicola CCALA 1050]MDR9898494.1 hypothetical protein [Aetokthonos hydrillicola Thurmond2011]